MPGRRCLSGNFGGTDEYEILAGIVVMRQNRGPQLKRKRRSCAGTGTGTATGRDNKAERSEEVEV